MKGFLFIVPARAGLKRLPGKNLIKLGNKTLIQWTDEALKNSLKKYDIMLTTDCKKIANQGKKMNWNVPSEVLGNSNAPILRNNIEMIVSEIQISVARNKLASEGK